MSSRNVLLGNFPKRQNTPDILGNMDEGNAKERRASPEMMADACDNKNEGAGVNSSETSAADSGAVEYKSGGGGGADADDGCGGTASNANAVTVDSSGAECVGAGDGGGDVDSGGVYVGNLPFNATEDDVRGLFQTFGNVRNIRIGRGFSTLMLSGPAAVDRALVQTKELTLGGRALIVEKQSRASNRSKI